jgi:hypothetical protein
MKQQRLRLLDLIAESVSKLPLEFDSNRDELGRSPGLRFFGLKQPSQRYLPRQWLTRLAPLRLQWLGRSGVKPDSHTTPSRTFYTGTGESSQIKGSQNLGYFGRHPVLTG